MKVKVITRNEADYTRERKSSASSFRTSARVQASIERRQAGQDFRQAVCPILVRASRRHLLLCQEQAAIDRCGVGKVRQRGECVWSDSHGSCDGELRLWDLSTGNCRWSTIAHSGFVRGVTFSRDGESLWSCGDDKLVKMWTRDLEQEDGEAGVAPELTLMGQHAFLGIDHHWKESLIATCGVDVHIWDPQRSEPLHTLSWGSESVVSVRFNPIEHNVLASTASGEQDAER
eukprot:766679-Hanusia_phi.AAC.3